MSSSNTCISCFSTRRLHNHIVLLRRLAQTTAPDFRPPFDHDEQGNIIQPQGEEKEWRRVHETKRFAYRMQVVSTVNKIRASGEVIDSDHWQSLSQNSRVWDEADDLFSQIVADFADLHQAQYQIDLILSDYERIHTSRLWTTSVIFILMLAMIVTLFHVISRI